MTDTPTGRGKTTVALEAASHLAEQGKRVITSHEPPIGTLLLHARRAESAAARNDDDTLVRLRGKGGPSAEQERAAARSAYTDAKQQREGIQQQIAELAAREYTEHRDAGQSDRDATVHTMESLTWWHNIHDCDALIAVAAAAATYNTAEVAA
jgi:hypothetical protein